MSTLHSNALSITSLAKDAKELARLATPASPQLQSQLAP